MLTFLLTLIPSSFLFIILFIVFGSREILNHSSDLYAFGFLFYWGAACFINDFLSSKGQVIFQGLRFSFGEIAESGWSRNDTEAGSKKSIKNRDKRLKYSYPIFLTINILILFIILQKG